MLVSDLVQQGRLHKAQLQRCSSSSSSCSSNTLLNKSPLQYRISGDNRLQGPATAARHFTLAAAAAVAAAAAAVAAAAADDRAAVAAAAPHLKQSFLQRPKNN